jgi:hypothetical protein
MSDGLDLVLQRPEIGQQPQARRELLEGSGRVISRAIEPPVDEDLNPPSHRYE